MPSYTGQVRTRRTSRRIAVADALAKTAITFGGIATIVAVAVVCLFLFSVALPLLRSGDVEARGVVAAPTDRPIHMVEDPYRSLAWLLQEDGQVVAFASRSGAEVLRQAAFVPAETSCVAPHENRILIGQRSGSVQLCTIDCTSDFVPDETTEPLVHLAPGQVAVVGGALFERTREGQIRRQRLRLQQDEPQSLGNSPVLLADFADTSSGIVMAAVTADGLLHFKIRSSRFDLLEDREIVTLDGSSIALRTLAPHLGDRLPDHALLAGAGDNLFLVWNDGRLLRLDTRDHLVPSLAEELDLLPDGRIVTSLTFLIGKSTLLVGDERGDVSCWFRKKPATTPDGSSLQLARVFPAAARSPVVALHASTRSRLFVIGQANGHLQVAHGTSERIVATADLPGGARLDHVAISPKEDGLLVASSVGLHRWDLRPGHPEVTLHSAFRPVWYEGAPGASHVWQSTSGTDDFEPKFGLWPLVFGTLKATLYCLLFGVPLALLAAIYTSEFLHGRTRARVKPAIELMASLPSVVLGFLAALVFAPIVEAHLMAVLASVLVVPFVFLLGAQVWQLAPPWLRPTAESLRVPAALLAVPTSLLLAAAVAPWLESALFAGDLKQWLAAAALPSDDPARGTAFGGWLLATLPVAGLLTAITIGRLAGAKGGSHAPWQRFAFGCGFALALASGASLLLTQAGFDLRPSLVSTYDQRNSLVVGFVMAFAVVPIIYTIAEDALSAVPEHLRAASLGAGATPWQTAVRIIVPTALSGVFSAVMIGLGRAVGETMIVLMAAGNTPVLDLNVFNGFRTLSANIATELPEAVRDSTHYRMLYLAALCLFVMTFVLNTLAEVVRQRFRRRAFQL